MLRARFSGLFGDGRGRDTGLAEAVLGRTERKDSLTPERRGVEKRPVWAGCADCGVVDAAAPATVASGVEEVKL